MKLLSFRWSSASRCAWKPSLSSTSFGGFCQFQRGTSQAKMPYLQFLAKQQFSHMKLIFEVKKNRRKGPTSLLSTNLSIHSDLKHHDWFSRWENHSEQVSKTSGACCFPVPQNVEQTCWDVTIIGTKFQDAFECDSCVPKVPFGPTVAATQSNLGVAVGRCGILWDPCSSPKL